MKRVLFPYKYKKNYSNPVRTKEKRVLSRYTHAGNTCGSYEPSCCLRQGATFTHNARTHMHTHTQHTQTDIHTHVNTTLAVFAKVRRSHM